ncbi:UNVERIFIED_CONTAM: hypothetical protein Sradi_6080200 [Sesamum radiatum]|uniref:X8 domain-containing protein n=1 Tax=Sesamum radiatum TaxID=300843 RepID=A0AAW2KIF9_SESRA
MVRGKTIIRRGHSAGEYQLRLLASRLQDPAEGLPLLLPDNLINHASIAMNLYYQAKGRNHWNCYFKNSGLMVVTDPSYGSCFYE